MKPGPCIGPFLACEVNGDAKLGGDLLMTQSGELAEFDHLRRDRVLRR